MCCSDDEQTAVRMASQISAYIRRKQLQRVVFATCHTDILPYLNVRKLFLLSRCSVMRRTISQVDWSFSTLTHVLRVFGAPIPSAASASSSSSARAATPAASPSKQPASDQKAFVIAQNSSSSSSSDSSSNTSSSNGLGDFNDFQTGQFRVGSWALL